MDLMLAFAFFIAVMVSAIVFRDFSMIIALLAALVAFIIVGKRKGHSVQSLAKIVGLEGAKDSLNCR